MRLIKGEKEKKIVNTNYQCYKWKRGYDYRYYAH